MAVKSLTIRGGWDGKQALGQTQGTPIVHSCYTYEGTDLETQPDNTKMTSGQPQQEQEQPEYQSA